MRKIIAIGDIHGRSFWKLIVNKLEPEFDRIIFIGDYFDSFDIKTDDQVNNFLDIIEYKRANMDKVVLLIGNHDHHYFPDIGNTGTSGYQHGGHLLIQHVLEQNRHLLKMAHSEGNVLFTHAGVGEKWLENAAIDIPDAGEVPDYEAETVADHVNAIWEYKPKYFIFNGREYSGDDMGQTPIWIRPRSLMRDSQDMKKNIIQVVGHTGMKKIDIEGKATGGRYYFIDTLGHSGEYLIIEDGVFKTGKI